VDEVHILWSDRDLSRIGDCLAGDQLHQGAFSAPVFTDKSQNATRFRLKRTLVDGLGRAECLTETIDSEHGLLRKNRFDGFGFEVVLGNKDCAGVDLLFDLLAL